LNKKENMTVNIIYQDFEQTFTGDPDQVWVSVNRFFGEMVPALNTVKKILLTVNLETLIEDCKKVLAIAPEGPVLLVSRDKLTDNETLTLHLLAAYIGNKLGHSKKSLTKEKLQAGLGKNAKITSTRLGELIRDGCAVKTDEGNYKITTWGIWRLQRKDLPEIKQKLRKKSRVKL
jgi:hypothetical protein